MVWNTHAMTMVSGTVSQTPVLPSFLNSVANPNGRSAMKSHTKMRFSVANCRG